MRRLQCTGTREQCKVLLICSRASGSELTPPQPLFNAPYVVVQTGRDPATLRFPSRVEQTEPLLPYILYIHTTCTYLVVELCVMTYLSTISTYLTLVSPLTRKKKRNKCNTEKQTPNTTLCPHNAQYRSSQSAGLPTNTLSLY